MNDLNKSTENFITTVNLSLTTDGNYYQFLYASQLYGTLFGIYGLFDCEISNDICTLKNVKLKLINYKGCVNMGIVEAKYIPSTKNLNIEVQPLSGVDEFPFPFVDAKGNYPVVSSGDFVIVNRILKTDDRRIQSCTMNEDGSKSRGKVFFDDELNYRDGYYEIPHPTREGHDDHKHVSTYKPSKFFLASPRCHQSNVMITF